MKKKKNIDDLLPLFSVENGLYVMKDGRVVVGYRLNPVEIGKLSAQGYDAITNLWVGASKSLPVGTVIQRLDFYYFKPFRVDLSQKGFFERQLINHFYHREELQHQSFLFISVGDEKPIRSNAFNTVFAYGKALAKNPFKNIEHRIGAAPRLGREFTNVLTTAGITTSRLNDEELADVYRMYFNLEFEPLPHCFQREFSASDNYAVLGEKKLNVISLNSQAGMVNNSTDFYNGVAAPFIYPLTYPLQIPHILSTSFCIEDSEKVISKLDSENKFNTFLGFLATQDNIKKSEEITSFTHEVRTYNKNTVNVNVSVIVWESDNNVRQSYIEAVTNAFSEMGQSGCFIETIDTANLFVANAPGNAYQNYRWLLMTGDNAAVYNNFITNYYRNTGGDELLCDRFRNPLRVSLYNKTLNNQNSIVIGPSGSGKSYTMGNFIVQRYELGHTQIILDVGGTYLSVVTALQGRYFEYDPEKPLKMNPFLIDRNKADGTFVVTGDKINFLISLLSIIWKGAKGEISQAERSIFATLLPLYYEEFNREYLASSGKNSWPSIKGFYYWLEKYTDSNDNEVLRKQAKSFNFDEFLIVLQPFVIGEYADVLNSETYEDLSSYKLICFDLINIKKNPIIYPVISLLITELALDVIRIQAKQRKYFYMDEAWSMLSDSLGDFVMGMYRTIRKAKGSMCIITQGIGEIIKSSIGPAILQNAATKIILNHIEVPQEIPVLAQHLGFTEHEMKLIMSIRKDDAEGFRELFIKQGDFGKVYLMEVALSIDAILTSQPEEREYLRDLQKQFGGNIHYAINQYVETKQASKEVANA
jgi:conjugal transfer ATP-binding protein TraC